MKILVLMAFVAALVYYFVWFIPKAGNLKFWKVVHSNPDEAYDFFMSHDSWRVFEKMPPGGYRTEVPFAEWGGPFNLVVPKLGYRNVAVFGRDGEYEETQKEFLKKHGDHRG